MVEVNIQPRSRGLAVDAFRPEQKFYQTTSAYVQMGIKRGLDIAATLLAAPFAAAVIGALALAVRLDGGTAFYAQPRLGRNGKVFMLWKLRSMVPDAERKLQEYLQENPAARAEWDHIQKLQKDPRVTPLGHYLRKYSLDELPQLWNVLKGDMSLVGPRPMFPEQRQQYPGSAYFELRPGITGLWQISDRNNCSFAERANHDTSYARILSLRADMRILAMTTVVVIRGTGY